MSFRKVESKMSTDFTMQNGKKGQKRGRMWWVGIEPCPGCSSLEMNTTVTKRRPLELLKRVLSTPKCGNDESCRKNSSDFFFSRNPSLEHPGTVIGNNVMMRPVHAAHVQGNTPEGRG